MAVRFTKLSPKSFVHPASVSYVVLARVILISLFGCEPLCDLLSRFPIFPRLIVCFQTAPLIERDGR